MADYSRLFGENLLTKEGLVSSSCLNGKVVGIYFSAHWCPPCRRFTPLLRKAYLDAVAAGKEFEVVFVSCDQNQVGFDEYFATMPWKAIPFEDADLRNKLNNTFGINGIPTLLLMDEEHGVFNEEGREAVTKNPNGFPWRN